MADVPKAPETPAAPPKDTANGVTRPKAGTQTGKIWEISDALSKATGKPAERKAVLEQAAAAGLNEATAATQYGRWRKYHGLKSEPRPPKPVAEGGPVSDVSTQVSPA